MSKHRWNGKCKHNGISGAARGYLYMKLYKCTYCKQVSTVPPCGRDENGRPK